MSIRIEQVITSGTFALDGGEWDVDNNVWVVGDDTECVIIDAAHDAEAIDSVVAGRTVRAILLSHGHNDHIDAAPALAERTGATTHLHPADRMLWDAEHPGAAPGAELADGQEFNVAGTTLRVLHTPGHSPGACCFHLPDQAVLFSGDTLFSGGPGATGRSYSDFGTIVDSITDKLLVLDAETVVHTGHGDSTTIGAEAPHRQDWIDRGH